MKNILYNNFIRLNILLDIVKNIYIYIRKGYKV